MNNNKTALRQLTDRRTTNRSSGLVKALAVAALASAAGTAALADTTGLSSAPIATLNSLNSAAAIAKPYTSIWGGTVSATGAGAAVSFNLSASTQGFQINNVAKTDFSAAGAIAIDVNNPTATEGDFLLVAYDTSGNSIKTRFLIPANTTQSVAMFTSPVVSATTFGFMNLPNPYTGIQTSLAYWAGGSINLAAVDHVTVYPNGNFPASSLVVSNLRALQAINWSALLTGAVDAYGQNNVLSWAGKLTNAGQFATRRSAEESSFTNLLGTSVDVYGGSTTMPNQGATGHFRAAKANGKWWLIDPLGNLFFMNGADQIMTNSSATMITGRTSLFASLPASTDPNYLNASVVVAGKAGTAFNFYTSNLTAKYGSGWSANFLSTVVNRYKTWGLNTFGEFCDSSVIGTHSAPYLKTLCVSGTYNHVSTGADAWGPMDDPFDPAFATSAATMAANNATLANTDPYLIGFVVENEPSWTGSVSGTITPLGLATGTLAQNAATSPAKTEFLRELTVEYGTIANLNTAWGTSFASWAAMSTAVTLPTSMNAALTTDLTNWVSTYADKYYSIIKNALKAVAPNTMYFGNSYSMNHVDNQIVLEAAKYVDALDFNLYGATPYNAQFVAAFAGVDMPVVSGEFNFSSSTDGITTSAGAAPDQNTRAAQYTAYVNACLTSHNFVGCNFYMWFDEPFSGELIDGSNNLQGMVDITDTPYSPMVTAIQNIATSMFALKWNS